MVFFTMSDILEFFKNIEVKLTEEEMIECFKQDVTEEEVDQARAYIRSLGFDPKSFCTEGNMFLTKVFSTRQSQFSDEVRDAVLKLQATFRGKGPFHSLIKLLYGIGFSLRDITFTLYRLGFRGIGQRSIRTHINNNTYEFNQERLKFMELIDCAKATVFQELQAEIKASEKKSALIYLKALERLNTELEDTDPVIEETKWNRLTRSIDKLQAKLNSMHGIEELRSATIQTAAKITLLKSAKSIEDGPSGEEGKITNAKTIEGDGEIISPFTEKDDKIISVPTQRLAS